MLSITLRNGSNIVGSIMVLECRMVRLGHNSATLHSRKVVGPIANWYHKFMEGMFDRGSF